MNGSQLTLLTTPKLLINLIFDRKALRFMGKVAITILIIGFFISLGYSKADPLFLENGKEYYPNCCKEIAFGRCVNNPEWINQYLNVTKK